ALTGQLRIGYRTAMGWTDFATTPYHVSANASYTLDLVLNGPTATLTVGTASVQYTFPNTLNTGMIGLGVNGSVSSFSSITVLKLPRNLVYTISGNFSSGSANGFTPQYGQWTVANSEYAGNPGTGVAITTRPLIVDPSSYVQYQSDVTIGTSGGVAGLI